MKDSVNTDSLEQEVLYRISKYGVKVAILKTQMEIQRSENEQEQKENQNILMYLLDIKKSPELKTRLIAIMN